MTIEYRFQYRDFAEAIYEALTEDAFYTTLEAAIASPDAARNAMLRYLDYSMVEALEYGELFVPDGQRYGASIWSTPVDSAASARKSRDKRAFLLEHLGQRALANYDEIVAFMSAQSDAHVDPSAWYLSIVGVLPEYQGQGIGVELIRPVLEKTDALGVATWLETFTPRNMSFYRRLGYDVVETFPEPTTAAEYAIMLRRPGG
jgi:GNAT superfamily N-acetyltransferase